MSTISLEPPAYRTSSLWNNVWEYRELLRTLVVRNLKIKYKRSAFGFLWTLLQPLFTIAVLYGVFSYVLGIGSSLPNYWAFLVSGYFVFNFFNATVSQATNVLGTHAAMARNVPFPTEIPVIGAIGSRLIEFAVELMLVLAIVMIIHHQAFTWTVVYVPLLVGVLLLFTTGIAFPVATLSVFYADVQHALPVVFRSLFYLSPVFYPISMVPDAIRPYYFLNPLTGMLELFHDVIYIGVAPSWQMVATMSIVSGLTFLAGFAVFQRFKPVFMDLL